MLCASCGRELADRVSICPGCGAAQPVANSDDQETGSFPDEQETGSFVASSSASRSQNVRSLGAPAPSAQTEVFASGPLALGEAFGTRYHIIHLLGMGGMGAVYQAWDAELGVAVAIKVIRPEVMADPGASSEVERRFKRELLLARQVTHKNVVRIHDLGEIGGIKYITMPFVDGSDLATVLKREGKLPVSRALRIGRGIVSGLVEAHAAGVVHRDLKPANVMIADDDEPMIMDFGIARSTGGAIATAAPGAAGRLSAAPRLPERYVEGTMVGVIVGTVEYMAPEQAKGRPVDQRADVYALGLMLYDMLVGRRRAEHAKSAIAELRGRMQQPPPALRSIVPEVPDALDRIVSRCLEPDPEKRYQTTTELEADLNRLDENGVPIPVKRVLGVPVAAAAGLLLVVLSSGIWWYFRPPPLPVVHDPVSVVIADLQNNTGDPSFDRVLEPTLKRALEGASFISAFDRNTAARTLGAKATGRFDEVAARELAVKQGLGVVLSGSLERQRGGYRLSVKATQTVTGMELASAQSNAANKDHVLDTATRLMTRVRNALGDDTSQSAQQFAMASLSATSLDVVRLYAAAMEAASRNKFAEARDHAAEAVTLDPKFGIGYLVMAVASRNMGRLDDNQKYINEALSHLDGMTEREKYQTRGYSFWVAGDYQQCVKEYGDLIAKYPGDVGGHNQLALCLSYLRQLRRAVQEMQAVVKILPSQPLFRDNLALYANYASEFQTAEQEARKVEGPDAYAVLALAFSQLGQGQLSEASDTYRRLAQMGPQGASFAASGLGDLAAVEGRFSEAVRILRAGAAEDLAAKNQDLAAAKLVAVANAELSQRRFRAAIEAADEALRQSSAVKIRFLAARTFVEAEDSPKARPLINGLAKELYAEPRAYAKIVEGGVALKKGEARQAMDLLREANGLFDTWIGQFDLGRASLAAGAFTQADSAFDVCVNARRGEALALFVDEEPTYAYLPQVHYYQGRVREGLKNAGFTESYRAYLAIRGNSREDPLVPEIRARVVP